MYVEISNTKFQKIPPPPNKSSRNLFPTPLIKSCLRSFAFMRIRDKNNERRAS